MRIWTRRAIAEAIGTFFLVRIGPGPAMVDAHTSGAVGGPIYRGAARS